MKIKIILSYLITLILVIFAFSGEKFTFVNTSHLDYLYEEAVVEGKPVGYIYIYSEAPDYRKVAAAGEGIACVDDAARAAIFYIRHFKTTGEEKSLIKARKLLDFLLVMQAENGFFYNFLLENHTINKKYKRSAPVPDWWTWRALWAMAEASQFYAHRDTSYYQLLMQSIRTTVHQLTFINKKYKQTTILGGFELPAWLPNETGADQAAVLVKAFFYYYQTFHDSLTLKLIQKLGKGVLMMQAGNSTQFPYGAFLSYQNLWHAWGNSQAEALFRAGNLLDKKTFIQAAKMETQFFHPYLIEQNYLKRFELKKETDSLAVVNMRRFEQIAYGIRPLVMANLQAYRMSGVRLFAKQAATIGSWLLGENVAGVAMYDPQTGRCYDGIDSANTINRNSGAESTIEALLTLLALEQNPVTRQFIHDYYFNKH